MFTPGSKLLFGLVALGVVAFAVVSIDASFDPVALILLGTMIVVAAFLGFVVIAFRDAEAGAIPLEAASSADAEGVAAAGPIVSPSPWPLLGGCGAVLVAVGLVTDKRVLLAGAFLLGAVVIEWMIQAWADRASHDPAYNERLRARIMGPVEYPILGVVIAFFVVYGASRLLLTLNEHAAVAVFSLIGALIFCVAIVISGLGTSVRRLFAPGVLLLGAAGVIAIAVVGLANGERTFEGHEPEKATSELVADKQNQAATVNFEDGKFSITGSALDADTGGLVVGRGERVTVVFNNKDAGERTLELEANGTTFKTAALAEDESQALTFAIGAPGTYQLRSGGVTVPVTVQ